MKLQNKRLISLLLAVIMMCSMMPIMAFSAENDHAHTYENGVCAECAEADPAPYAGKTIACIGDSITCGVGVTKDETDYVTLLAKSLQMNYIRLGVSGTTLCTGGHRSCNIGKLTEENLSGADVVTVLMGINDFDQARDGYYALGNIGSKDTSTIYGALHMWCQKVEQLRKTDSLKDTEFYFLTPVITSWNDSVSSARNWDQSKTTIHGYTLRDLCNAIIEVCSLYDINVIDLNLISGMYYNNAEDNNVNTFGGDGVHPGANGHQMMANAIEKALLKKNLYDDHAHNFGSWITTRYPKCDNGEKKRVCQVCAATESEVLNGAGHTYENGTCAACGAKTSQYLQQLPENIIGCTDLYDILTPTKGYYTATKYDTSNVDVLSVVIPVEEGDRIAASSFGAISENMGSVNGIRVTYLLGDEIAISVSPSEVYNEYKNNGYITVPSGVDAVCIPWWKPSDSNWLTLSQISKDFAIHSPKYVSEQAPTCTESGYTAGEICEICNISLNGRTEISPVDHTYSNKICVVCGAVDLDAFLRGKYVSILGDSISTFNGYSNDDSVNTTIGGNGHRYDVGTADTKPGSYCLLESVDHTWWGHFANRHRMKLLVNNSWAGSQVFGGKTSDGRIIPAAYLDRCLNLHDNTLENNANNAPINPDIIFVYMGINDYNFNRSNVGGGSVDYASLINDDGSYITPTTFGEAYGIMLHKMKAFYPDSQIFVMTLLPENLYSIDMAAWEQHNTYIRAAAEYYDIPVIDLAASCEITWENYSGYMIDRIHPTTEGMRLISECIEKGLLSYYGENHNSSSLVITKQPENTTVELGERFTFAVEAEGDGLTYQWYYKDASMNDFAKSYVTGSTYSFEMLDFRVGREYYCVISDQYGNSVTTDIVKSATPLTITEQPTDVTLNIGEQIDLSVKAVGEGLSYQWYYRDSGDTEFRKSVFTGKRYSRSMEEFCNGRQVYCVITDTYGNSVQTDIATVSRTSKSLSIIAQPVNVQAEIGQQFEVSFEAEGDGLTYQWYYKDSYMDDFAVSASKTKSYSYTMQEYRHNRQVYCVITDAYGNSVKTDVVTLTRTYP